MPTDPVRALAIQMLSGAAVMAVLGRRAWKLPRRLERIVPEVDLEGEGLAKSLQPTPST